MCEVFYLILKNGHKFKNGSCLEAGQIYPAEDFEHVHEQRKAALVLNRILYRGTESEVREKRAKLFGIGNNDEQVAESKKEKRKAAR